MKRFPTRQEHPLSSAASGLRLPLPTCFPAATPRKRGRIPGDRPALGACPAGQSPPGCASPHAGKAASQPRPGAPGFGGTFAILKPESVDWISRSDFLLARTSARLCGLRDSAPSAHLPSRCHAPQKRPPSGSDGGAADSSPIFRNLFSPRAVINYHGWCCKKDCHPGCSHRGDRAGPIGDDGIG